MVYPVRKFKNYVKLYWWFFGKASEDNNKVKKSETYLHSTIVEHVTVEKASKHLNIAVKLLKTY